MKKYPFDIGRLREVVANTNESDWYRNSCDNSNAKIFEFKSSPKNGEYFLCDCIGNTIDLCRKTKRKFRNADGRLVNCKVIETLIPDCHAKFGTALNGVWVIPRHLF